MADITTISAALGSLKTAHELVTILKNSSESLEKAGVKFELAELIYALADTKMELAGIQSVIIEKDAQIKTLQAKLDEQDSLVYEAPYYWLQNGSNKDGPFCQRCKDVDRLNVRLQNIRRKGDWICKSCDSNYVDSNYVPAKRSAPSRGIY
ncbi:hypothetical protein [Aliivibrio sp. SR45-2]|uniref:hypothetical protein n=1 Tax=Aliivibrio sp. SR45-2 TaxID=2760931 RepID=UPI0015FB67A0|nr:hypothetical protein [Aliivibrio sp. SR45-2]MBB1315875.1 hypothetical protein [Aliivibrio sp. SR45-2]